MVKIANENDAILKFMMFLGHVRGLFRRVHISAEKNPLLHGVSTTVNPFIHLSSKVTSDAVISISLNAELVKAINLNKQALGMSFLLSYVADEWLAEYEVGWTGATIGWDVFVSKKVQSRSIDDIIDESPEMVRWMAGLFESEIAKLSGP